MRYHQVLLTSFLALAFYGATGIAAEVAPDAFDTPLDAVKSPYTDKLIALGREWAAKPVAPQRVLAGMDLRRRSLGRACHRFKCSATTRRAVNRTWGCADMNVDAPVSRVDEVVANIDEYQKLFPGFKDIHITKKEGNRWLTAWEQIIPVFF